LFIANTIIIGADRVAIAASELALWGQRAHHDGGFALGVAR
jgi:hypothetical protein